MLLLVTDTSGKHGTVALARALEGSDNVELIEEVALAGGTFSAQLVPQIAALLLKHGFTKNDIGAFIVVSGPGSFTGLRVGLAAIKALAEVLDKPIVPLSLLEVLALDSEKTGTVLAALDAGRSNVYAGEYDVSDHKTRLVSERLLSKDEFLTSARNIAVVTADESVTEMARAAGISPVKIASPGAGKIAKLGWQKLQRNECISPAQLDANYMRRTDAEIFTKQS
jgi:tRNA threonylcarbamoyladenosine biosynthesis protein TsaB